MQQILEVAIGLVLVTAVVSLVVSASMEILATALRLRSRALVQGLGRLLDNTLKEQDLGPTTIALLRHPMIAATNSPAAAKNGRTPSYIDAITFTTAFLDTSMLGATLVGKFVNDKQTIDTLVATLGADESASSEALKRTWATSGRSPAALVSALLDDPDGNAALARLMGTPQAVTARIASLQAADDPMAERLQRAWTGAAVNVAVFVRRLVTPELITSLQADTAAVDSAIQDITAVLPHLGRTLQQLRIQAGGDVDEFRQEIEDWYDRQMERVSGWYTRWTKWIMVILGLAIALALNVSLTTIGLSLWRDSTLRNNIVSQANAIVKAQQSQQTTTTTTTTISGATPAPASTTKCINPDNAAKDTSGSTAAPGATGIAGYTCLQSIDLPIGWNRTAWPGSHDIPFLGLHLLGIVMIGIATSFGAPFWFGVLNNLINIRGGGPKPEPAAVQRAATSS